MNLDQYMGWAGVCGEVPPGGLGETTKEGPAGITKRQRVRTLLGQVLVPRR
jgi:hypothetical protein